MKRIGVREATREAIEMAAAMLENEDHFSLFRDETNGRADAQEDGSEVLATAQATAVRRIRNLLGKKNAHR